MDKKNLRPLLIAGGALPPAANGMTIFKSIWTMAGAPADAGTLHQNDRVIIEVSGTLPNNFYRQMGLIDLLPAGHAATAKWRERKTERIAALMALASRRVRTGPARIQRAPTGLGYR